ncbi:MAG: ATP-binding protein [Clostridiales bacterium]|nr:ATP-binding protein [Clostridiales bacterium]
MVSRRWHSHGTLLKDIYISQKDIREVQLAKGAIAAGIKILIKDMDISYDGMEYVYLAGGLGNYIDYNHASDIGLIPDALKNKIRILDGIIEL